MNQVALSIAALLAVSGCLRMLMIVSVALLGFSVVFRSAFGRGGCSTRTFWETSQALRTHNAYDTPTTAFPHFFCAQ